MSDQFSIQTKSLFLEGKEILSSSSLTLEEGEIYSVIGKSGVGKTQLLKLISQENDDVSFVFQTHNLFPWLTLFENLKVSLHVSDNEILGILKRFNLYSSKDYYPNQVSIGMLQRCNLARAILNPSKIILMDEPFSALDYFQKEELRTFVREIFSEYRRTALLVTHDIEEAVFLSKKIFLLSGRPAALKELDLELMPYQQNFKSIRYDDQFISLCNKVRERFE